MPSESIGECGGAQYPDKDWIAAELELGICYIRHACGEPPAGYELDIIWHEHEVGEYATIGITWDGYGDAPWDYISRAEGALARFDDAVAWSELVPEPEDDDDEDVQLDEGEDNPDDDDEAAGSDENPDVQQASLFSDKELNNIIELYRRDEMIDVAHKDWHMALLIFREMGWQPIKPFEIHTRPLMFVTHDEGQAMQRADRSLFALIQNEPFVSTSVQMDLGLFYRLTDFVGGGAFIVGRSGSHDDPRLMILDHSILIRANLVM
jgi:hypothetical protein